MSTLHFNISGEYITDLARTWFWDERRPIQTCLDLISTCMSDAPLQDIKDVTISILEGRKKFTGVNEFELVPDNRHIRSLTDYIVDEQKEQAIQSIKLDMIASFAKYVDKWATVKSSHPNVLTAVGNPTSYEECRNYYTTTAEHLQQMQWAQPLMIGKKELIDTPTMGGLWLIQEPELVYQACNGDLKQIGSDSFWDAIYEYIKEKPEFEDRNRRYQFYRKPKPTIEERMNRLIKMTQMQPQTNAPYLSDQWFLDKYQETKNITYVLEPDAYEQWEGLIAPNGDFYSVTFGSHNQKAYYLLVKHPEWINKTQEDIIHSDSIRADNSLDILRNLNWAATRSVVNDHYMLPEHPTKRQIESILTAAEKHNASIDTQNLLSYL